MTPVFDIGDGVIVVGGPHDGLLGTILRRKDDRYLVALEDGTEVLLTAQDLTARR